jgi:hypothetical protein
LHLIYDWLYSGQMYVMMKKILWAFVALISMIGCTGSKTQPEKDSIDSTDTAAEVVDSIDSVITASPMPKSADELFDDFFFNFAANKKLQLKRITFPLKVMNGKNIITLQKNQWKQEHFFMRQDYYTVIFDNEKQMSLVKDTSVNHVVVEKINLNVNNVKQYVFDRVNGQFMLTCINNCGVYQSNNASFLQFYRKFASDSAYQVRSLAREVKFIGPDPDDDFSSIEGIITPDTWFGFAPSLPKGIIYNIIYGQKYQQSNQKIFVKRGIANGLEIELTFRKLRGKWKLVKLET